MRIAVAQLEKLPADYRDRLLAAGTVKGALLQLSNADYVRLATQRADQTANAIYFRPEEGLRAGDVFALIIRRLTGIRMCSLCRKRRDWMNSAGWWKCWTKRAMIKEWMTQELRARGHELPEGSAWHLFLAVMKEVQRGRRGLTGEQKA